MSIIYLLGFYFLVLYLIYRLASFMFSFVHNRLAEKYQKSFSCYTLKVLFMGSFLWIILNIIEMNLNENMTMGFLSALHDNYGEQSFYFMGLFFLVTLLGLLVIFVRLGSCKNRDEKFIMENMNIKCTNCKKTIYLEKNTLEFIEKSKRNGREFIMLDCNNCGLGFPFNPQNKELLEAKPVWKCPIFGCSGYVSYLDENETPYKDGKSFYGCGETGKMWYKKEDFYKDIEKTIQEYPYRKECYTYKDNEWLPNDCEIDEFIDLEKDKMWN